MLQELVDKGCSTDERCRAGPAAGAAGGADASLSAALPLLLQPGRAGAGQRRARHRDLVAGARARRRRSACCRCISPAASRSCGAILPTSSPHAAEVGLYGNLITSGIGLDRAARRGLATRPGSSTSSSASRTPTSSPATGSRASARRTGGKASRRGGGAGRRTAADPQRGGPSAEPRAARRDDRAGGRARRRAAGDRACPVLRLGVAQPRRAAADPRTTERRDANGRGRPRPARRDLVIDYVVPDYYASRPKACMGGWGRRFLNVTPSGRVLPCHAAETLPGLVFPTVIEASLAEIWYRSAAFARFRGTAWMPEPCRSCERARDRLGRLPLPGFRADRRRRADRSRLRLVPGSFPAD